MIADPDSRGHATLRRVTDARPRIHTAERRARLGRRHHLAPDSQAPTVNEASNDLVGLHASDPVSVYLAAWSRVRDLETKALDTALYEDRRRRRTSWRRGPPTCGPG